MFQAHLSNTGSPIDPTISKAAQTPFNPQALRYAGAQATLAALQFPRGLSGVPESDQGLTGLCLTELAVSTGVGLYKDLGINVVLTGFYHKRVKVENGRSKAVRSS